MIGNECFHCRSRVTCHKVIWTEANFENCCFRVQLPDNVCVCVRAPARARVLFSMLVTTAHGSQFTGRHEAVILWCCYPESWLPPLTVFSGISWCNQLYGCLTDQWEAGKLPYHATLLSVSPTLDPKQMIAGFVCLLLFLCSEGFCQWGSGNGREQLCSRSVCATCKGRCVIVIVTVASPTSNCAGTA